MQPLIEKTEHIQIMVKNFDYTRWLPILSKAGINYLLTSDGNLYINLYDPDETKIEVLNKLQREAGFIGNVADIRSRIEQEVRRLFIAPTTPRRAIATAPRDVAPTMPQKLPPMASRRVTPPRTSPLRRTNTNRPYAMASPLPSEVGVPVAPDMRSVRLSPSRIMDFQDESVVRRSRPLPPDPSEYSDYVAPTSEYSKYSSRLRFPDRSQNSYRG